jgi:hypothetical protein
MGGLNERHVVLIIHRTKLFMCCRQRDGWIDLPMQAGYNVY